LSSVQFGLVQSSWVVFSLVQSCWCRTSCKWNFSYLHALLLLCPKFVGQRGDYFISHCGAKAPSNSNSVFHL